MRDRLSTEPAGHRWTNHAGRWPLKGEANERTSRRVEDVKIPSRTRIMRVALMVNRQHLSASISINGAIFQGMAFSCILVLQSMQAGSQSAD